MPSLSPPNRRSFLLAVTCGTAVASVKLAWGDDVAVPVELQAEILLKLIPYDKNLTDRAGDRVRVMAVVRRGNAESERASDRFRATLSGVQHVGGLPLVITEEAFVGVPELVARIRAQRVCVAYLAPGLREEILAIADALDGVNVLTVASVSAYVPSRAVLGFDLVSGKPKILIHLLQARKQLVAFRPEVLRLMKVYQ